MSGGTSVTPVFEKDGQYLTLTVNEANGIAMGKAVELDSAGDVSLLTNASTTPIGVAVGTPRTSRTQTDNTAADNTIVTVCTRGVVNLTTSAAAINEGDFVQGAGSGTVKALTLSAATDVNKILGRALTAVGSSGGTVKVLLMLN